MTRTPITDTLEVIGGALDLAITVPIREAFRRVTKVVERQQAQRRNKRMRHQLLMKVHRLD